MRSSKPSGGFASRLSTYAWQRSIGQGFTEYTHHYATNPPFLRPYFVRFSLIEALFITIRHLPCGRSASFLTVADLKASSSRTLQCIPDQFIFFNLCSTRNSRTIACSEVVEKRANLLRSRRSSAAKLDKFRAEAPRSVPC